jgi:16S rRNA U1498 N3-methylase RsmE
MRRWVIEASKQCGRNALMELSDLMPWTQYLNSTASSDRRILADRAGEPISSLPREPVETAEKLALEPPLPRGEGRGQGNPDHNGISPIATERNRTNSLTLTLSQRERGLIQYSPSARRIAIAVGPEGGFTAEELARARASDWTTMSLGPRTLRVETAALAMVVRLTSAIGP